MLYEAVEMANLCNSTIGFDFISSNMNCRTFEKDTQYEFTRQENIFKLIKFQLIAYTYKSDWYFLSTCKENTYMMSTSALHFGI